MTEPQTTSNDCCCEPGSNCCGKTACGKTAKTVISLIILLAIVGIFIYKATSNKNGGAQDAAAFTFTQFTSRITPVAGFRLPNVVADIHADQKFGEDVESLRSLNQVARNQDAVFVFIPDAKNDLGNKATNTAALAAQRALKSRNIASGLYTLPHKSSDYTDVAAHVQAPAILVACKGKSTTVVSGDVTEEKLLQAFMASSAGGCCCGASGCCK